MVTRAGILGEEIARTYLKKKGYAIIDTHFCIRGGEIDIIAKKSNKLVFVEVKSRSIYSKGKAYEAFTKIKFFRMKRTIPSFLKKYEEHYGGFQIDVICIEFEQDFQKYNISHYKNISLEDLR